MRYGKKMRSGTVKTSEAATKTDLLDPINERRKKKTEKKIRKRKTTASKHKKCLRM